MSHTREEQELVMLREQIKELMEITYDYLTELEQPIREKLAKSASREIGSEVAERIRQDASFAFTTSEGGQTRMSKVFVGGPEDDVRQQALDYLRRKMPNTEVGDRAFWHFVVVEKLMKSLAAKENEPRSNQADADILKRRIAAFEKALNDNRNNLERYQKGDALTHFLQAVDDACISPSERPAHEMDKARKAIDAFLKETEKTLKKQIIRAAIASPDVLAAFMHDDVHLTFSNRNGVISITGATCKNDTVDFIVINPYLNANREKLNSLLATTAIQDLARKCHVAQQLANAVNSNTDLRQQINALETVYDEQKATLEPPSSRKRSASGSGTTFVNMLRAILSNLKKAIGIRKESTPHHDSQSLFLVEQIGASLAKARQYGITLYANPNPQGAKTAEAKPAPLAPPKGSR